MSTPSKTRATRTPVQAAPTPTEVADAGLPCQDRQAMIAEAAFFIAESRGFSPGQEYEDWLAAERVIERQLQTDPH